MMTITILPLHNEPSNDKYSSSNRVAEVSDISEQFVVSAGGTSLHSVIGALMGLSIVLQIHVTAASNALCS